MPLMQGSTVNKLYFQIAKTSLKVQSLGSTITLAKQKQRGDESLLEVYTTLNPSICGTAKIYATRTLSGVRYR